MNKICTKCFIERDINEFDFRKSANRFEAQCKICRRAKQNAFHKLNPQHSVYVKEYYKKYLSTKPKGYAYAQVKKARIRWSKKYNVTVSAIAHHSLKVARLVFDKFDRKCNRCGSAEHLAIHHIDGKGRNYTKLHLKPNNNIDNLELLCIRCHGRIHGLQMKGKKYKKRL